MRLLGEPRRAEPASSSFLATRPLHQSSRRRTRTRHGNVVTLVRTRAHRGSYTRRHLDSPYPPYSSVRTTRLRTVYTTVRQGRGSPLRQRARRGPPRVIPIASSSRLVLPHRHHRRDAPVFATRAPGRTFRENPAKRTKSE